MYVTLTSTHEEEMRVQPVTILLTIYTLVLMVCGCPSNTQQAPKQSTLQPTSPQQDFQAQIPKIVKKHQSEIKYCYEKELKKSPDLAGTVTVNFTIGPDGLVSTANLKESTVNNTALEQCVVSFVQKWTFPHPEDSTPVKVTYPFVFTKE